MDAEYLKKTFRPVHNGDSPIYLQLANYFQMQIKSGVLAEKAQMLPEEEISHTLGISRTTVRQAMNLLVEQGLLVRYRGKGTFVSEKKYTRSFSHLYNFSNDMATLGVTPSSRTIRQEVIDIKGSHIQEYMELPSNQTTVFHLIRIRLADGKPVLYEDTYMPYFLCPGIEMHNFDQKSLYETLKNQYNVSPHTATENLQALIIPKNIQVMLECEPNTVGYKINRIARLDSNFIYEYTTSYTRADLCSYHFQLNNTAVSKANSSIVFSEETDKANI